MSNQILNLLQSELQSTTLVPIFLEMIDDTINRHNVSIIYHTLNSVCGQPNIVALFMGNEFFGYGVYFELGYMCVTVTIPHHATGQRHTILFEYDNGQDNDIYQTYDLSEIISVLQLVEF